MHTIYVAGALSGKTRFALSTKSSDVTLQSLLDSIRFKFPPESQFSKSSPLVGERFLALGSIEPIRMEFLKADYFISEDRSVAYVKGSNGKIFFVNLSVLINCGFDLKGGCLSIGEGSGFTLKGFSRPDLIYNALLAGDSLSVETMLRSLVRNSIGEVDCADFRFAQFQVRKNSLHSQGHLVGFTRDASDLTANGREGCCYFALPTSLLAFLEELDVRPAVRKISYFPCPTGANLYDLVSAATGQAKPDAASLSDFKSKLIDACITQKPLNYGGSVFDSVESEIHILPYRINAGMWNWTDKLVTEAHNGVIDSISMFMYNSGRGSPALPGGMSADAVSRLQSVQHTGTIALFAPASDSINRGDTFVEQASDGSILDTSGQPAVTLKEHGMYFRTSRSTGRQRLHFLYFTTRLNAVDAAIVLLGGHFTTMFRKGEKEVYSSLSEDLSGLKPDQIDMLINGSSDLTLGALSDSYGLMAVRTKLEAHLQLIYQKEVDKWES